SDGNGSHASTLKSPSYTKSVSWQHYQKIKPRTSNATSFSREQILQRKNTTQREKVNIHFFKKFIK
ncbi:hypothetical protein ABEK57_10450, partial [Klebsiella pneumoniae]